MSKKEYNIFNNAIVINTFASQPLVFEGKNELSILENVSNLTHEFLYDNFNKKTLSNFLL